ncbi:helix-turn-helix domain-containing protein [Spirosoma endbachense]|uniref:Helix-turn-helix domain-containing protein n=1 Tax=Spirosoma endbachense TaxID=2666025 RepID=A0A6P1W4S3_9BACT|nr:helix-turn-helix domain-containing protein [Spirosoma endbachense]QHW00434.1 helix-turn-helix domain-containing protein [Spirosoma endbachense]
MNNRTKAKSDQVPTLTPDTLGGLVFKIAGWQSMQGPIYNTFHINRLEEVRQVMKFPMPPHRKTVIDFIFITHGSMVRQKGLTRYEVPANTFFFLPAHQISFDDWMSDDIRGFYCHFDTNLLTKRWQKQDLENEFPFLQFLGHPLVTIDNELLTQVMPLVNRLYTEYKKKRFDSIDIFRIYLLTLFTELKRATQFGENTPPDHNHNAALRFTQLYKNALSQFIYKKQQVAEYADLLNISPNHLNKCVKAVTGQSARDLLDEMILLEAKVLLAQTDLSVSEIAYQIGKQDPSNFGRFFRAKMGITPKEYREVD